MRGDVRLEAVNGLWLGADEVVQPVGGVGVHEALPDPLGGLHPTRKSTIFSMNHRSMMMRDSLLRDVRDDLERFFYTLI